VKHQSAFLTILRNYSIAPDIPHADAFTQQLLTEKRGPEIIVPDDQQQPIYHFTITAPIVNNDVMISVIHKLVDLRSRRHVNIRISIKLIEGITTSWDVCIDGKTMLVSVPPGILAEGSKQSLVCLLELGSLIECNCCIVAFKKDCRDRSQLMRTFMFLGFQPIPAPQQPPAYFGGKAKGHICMAYEID